MLISYVSRPPLTSRVVPSCSQGYTFDAQFDGATFPVTVPAGGVKQGQKFVVPYPAAARESAAAPAPPRSSIPVGRWKVGQADACALRDRRPPVASVLTPRVFVPCHRRGGKDGLCDCCRFGCCHPACCNAFWCPLSEYLFVAPSDFCLILVCDN